jgi:ABC-type dipeptide/oligopeptide/nickel transport system permease component
MTPAVPVRPRSRASLSAVGGSTPVMWGRYLLRRLAAAFITLLGVCTITFVMVRVIGNPVYLLVGQQTSQEIVDAMTRSIGLDQPIWVQYGQYLGQLATGDLGISRATFRPVMDDVLLRLPATLELVLAAMIIVVAVALPLGIAAATRRDGIVDRLAQLLAQVGASIPGFWFGLLLVYVFFAQLQVLPAPLGRLDRFDIPPPRVTGLYTIDSLLAGDLPVFLSAVSHLILPAVTLALAAVPASLLITRNSLIGVLDSQYIRTARAFGLKPRTVNVRYAARNVLVPLITVLAMTFGFLMSGTVLVEVVFAWPGLGFYAVTAMNQSDYDPIQAVVLLGAIFYIGAYLVGDILSAAIDPRIRA